MKKNTTLILVLIALFVSLPAFQGNATISPEEIAQYSADMSGGDFDDNLTANGVHDYDGNTIEVIDQDNSNTRLLMNNTYQLDIHHNDTNMHVVGTKLDPIISPAADEMLFDVELEVTPDGQEMSVILPTGMIEISHSTADDDEWEVFINEQYLVDLNTTDRSIEFSNGTHTFSYENGVIEFFGPLPTDNFVIERVGYDGNWTILTPDGVLDIFFNDTFMEIEFMGGPVLPFGPHPPGAIAWEPPYFPTISIGFVRNEIAVEWEGVSILIEQESISIFWGDIVLIWYFLLLIETIVIMIWDITIIFYISIVELLIVIIYETFEIKIYETQIVLVYQYIEIVLLFVSILIWQFTFIFHFEFWFIQLIFIFDLVLNIIILPVRLIFIPVVIPVFIPLIFYVPMYILMSIHIYLPYQSPEMFIDVVDEDLQMPTHTIQYKVTDQSGLAINDATVSIAYNGTAYPATFQTNGIYEVELPASTEPETITVTATKNWYPTAALTYDLEVDWIIDTVTTNVTTTETTTVEGSIALAVASISIISVLLGFVIYRRKRRD